MSYFKLPDKGTICCDVDETLIMWFANPEEKDTRIIECPDGTLFVKFHKEHIELIKQLKIVGWNIVVWSQTGSDHAERVAKATGLDKYMDLCMPKPEITIDDIPLDQQGIKRIYKEYKP